MIPLYRLPPERLRPVTAFDRWKLHQQRQQWVYAAVAGALIALIAFVVAGGCR